MYVSSVGFISLRIFLYLLRQSVSAKRLAMKAVSKKTAKPNERQTPSKTQTDKEEHANRQRDKRTKIVTYGGNNFNDFPDNQLTKFRVFIG